MPLPAHNLSPSETDGGDGDEWWADLLKDDDDAASAAEENPFAAAYSDESDDDGFNPFLDAVAEDEEEAAAAPAEAPPTGGAAGGSAPPSAAKLRPGLIRDSVRMTAEKGSAGMTAKPAAPPPAASHLRPGMLRDSRRLAHAPRRKMDFQKSVRQSLRKRRGHPGALLGHALRGQGGSGIGEERGGKRLYGARGEKAVAMDARSPWH